MLAPSGLLALIWNERDVSVPWVAAYDAVLASYYPASVPRQQSKAWKRAFEFGAAANPLFGPLTLHTYPWSQPCTLDSLVALALSKSVIAKLQADEKKRAADRVRDVVLREYPSARTAGHSWALPYRTELYTCRNLAR